MKMVSIILLGYRHHPLTLVPQQTEQLCGVSTRVAEKTIIKTNGRKTMDRPFKRRKSASVLLLIGPRCPETLNHLLIHCDTIISFLIKK